MNSLLITAGIKEERIKKAKQIVDSEKISQFDTYILKPELSIGITEIRELAHWLNLKPYQSKIKAAIISQAEKLTIEAQNALLKSLEEPPEKTLIILLSPNADVLLPTIISRCQIINLSQKSHVLLTEGEFTQYFNILMSLFNADIGKKFKIAAEFSKSREETIDWLNKEITVLELLLKNKVLNTKKSRYSAYSGVAPIKSGLYADIPISRYPDIIRSFQQTKFYIQANINVRFSLENLFLSLASNCSDPGSE